MSRAFGLVLFLFLSPAVLAGPYDSFGFDTAPEQRNNIPDQNVLALLTRAFDVSKTPMSLGDLNVGMRWSCREFFAEASGTTHFRFRSLFFSDYGKGIIEDYLNLSPRFYTWTRDGLVGQSNARPGEVTEIRVDHDGNLRLQTRRNGSVKALLVCFEKFRQPANYR